MAIPVRHQEARRLNRISLFLYGQKKVGKTSTAAQFPSPLLVSCNANGTDMLTGVDVLDCPDIKTLERCVGELATSSYKTIVLDDITWLARTYVAAERNNPERHNKNEMAVYRELGEKMVDALAELMRSDKLVVATGHSRIFQTDEYVKVKRGYKEVEEPLKETRLDTNPSLAEDLFGLFSFVFYCYQSGNERFALTKTTENKYGSRIIAGDRSGMLPKSMPLNAAHILAELRKLHTEKPKPPAPATPAEPESPEGVDPSA